MRDILRASAIAAAALSIAACDRGIAPAMKPGEFLITTLSAPPGRSVTRSFGFYCRWFTYAPGADYGAVFTAANLALKTEGEKTGANAFINLSVATLPSTDAKAPGSLVMLCGDFASVK